MDIKEYIKDIVREIVSEDELEEMSVSGDAGAYSTPYAFRGNKKGENAATKAAISQGFKKASTSLPKNSKVVDYKQLFEDEYEMNQDPKTKEFTKRIKLSDKDKETVKKIQALMAKQKKTINEKLYDFKYKLGDTFKINNIPSDIDPAYADVKIGDEIKIIKVWSNLAGPVYGTNVSEKTGLNEKDIEKMISNNSIKENIEEIVKEELIKEGTYSKFKNEVKLRSKNEMLHKAIKEVKRKLMEIDRIVEYTSMMKQELSEGEEGLNYWKATTNNVSRIAEMVNELNIKIQNLQQ
jgi:hypothetical protein